MVTAEDKAKSVNAADLPGNERAERHRQWQVAFGDVDATTVRSDVGISVEIEDMQPVLEPLLPL